MEDKLFEFRYEQDDAFLKDYLKYAYFRMPARRMILALYVLCSALMVGVAVYITVKVPASAWIFWVLAAFFIVVLAWMNIFRYFQSVKVSQNRKKELYGDSPIVCEGWVTDTELYISNTGNNSENTLSVSSFKKVRETKTLIVTVTAARLMSVIPKNAFTKGTAEEFVKFLHDKGVK
ncbi:MAG: YcxB family protein [Clostridia bacterium]|nr:YcxB family protein [Clostridia bacterium]MBR7032146.1 YcxB family protein [Clostridia bacterium]